MTEPFHEDPSTVDYIVLGFMISGAIIAVGLLLYGFYQNPILLIPVIGFVAMLTISYIVGRIAVILAQSL